MEEDNMNYNQFKELCYNDFWYIAVGFLVWVIGDILTTAYGFSIGLHEANPMMIGGIYGIIAIKIIAFITIVFLAFNIKSRVRYISYGVVVLFGTIITLSNIYQILQQVG